MENSTQQSTKTELTTVDFQPGQSVSVSSDTGNAKPPVQKKYLIRILVILVILLALTLVVGLFAYLPVRRHIWKNQIINARDELELYSSDLRSQMQRLAGENKLLLADEADEGCDSYSTQVLSEATYSCKAELNYYFSTTSEAAEADLLRIVAAFNDAFPPIQPPVIPEAVQGTVNISMGSGSGKIKSTMQVNYIPRADVEGCLTISSRIGCSIVLNGSQERELFSDLATKHVVGIKVSASYFRKHCGVLVTSCNLPDDNLSKKIDKINFDTNTEAISRQDISYKKVLFRAYAPTKVPNGDYDKSGTANRPEQSSVDQYYTGKSNSTISGSSSSDLPSFRFISTDDPYESRCKSSTDCVSAEQVLMLRNGKALYKLQQGAYWQTEYNSVFVIFEAYYLKINGIQFTQDQIVEMFESLEPIN